jgi:hypothetical protein
VLKKLILVIVLVSTTTFALFANTTTSNLYYQTLRIEKIYPMRAGYRVIYITPVGTLHDLYVPMSWFGTGDGKAVLIAGDNPTYPYLAIYWKNDKFDYIKLYVKNDPADPSWGEIPPGFDLQGKFPTNGTLKIQWR